MDKPADKSKGNRKNKTAADKNNIKIVYRKWYLRRWRNLLSFIIIVKGRLWLWRKF